MTVHIDNMTRVFDSPNADRIVAVDELSLTIEDGEFLTLVGPSGCGKTTTLRCVAGLDTPTAGTIRVDDRDVTELPPQQRDVALLFQDIALYPHMSVRENMEYGLKIAGVPEDERREHVAEAAALLQIGDQLDKMPASLSGGQQQRVALGRSLVRDPSVFLFDEPMSDLDAKLKRELRPVVQRITDEIGCPVLYVTHDQEEAMTMSDRIAIMDDGELQQAGSPKEVYSEPTNDFVGEFIGQPAMEFFDARVESANGTAAVSMGNHTVSLPATAAELEGYVDSPVRVGVRPQQIGIGDPAAGIEAEHVLDEPLGDETHSIFETEFGDVTVVTHADFDGDGDTDYGLVLDESATQLFDPDSGVRIH
ncbi:ABC transporter ATP-binding protein [Natrialba aegyptia]|uniref:ABC-type D-xylose/L-arabinose transporter n=1 Tax=Natrialba aegyptia DSM 13077 TaxID=1227491 RepID=M0BAP6_9EURY|nr:ABC transporter ATP-binding protein [Natrialba aegyptia]ELZ07522.1 ABC transporter [Natrialba aegyptia DSM 13077]